MGIYDFSLIHFTVMKETTKRETNMIIPSILIIQSGKGITILFTTITTRVTIKMHILIICTFFMPTLPFKFQFLFILDFPADLKLYIYFSIFILIPLPLYPNGTSSNPQLS